MLLQNSVQVYAHGIHRSQDDRHNTREDESYTRPRQRKAATNRYHVLVMVMVMVIAMVMVMEIVIYGQYQ